MAGLDYDVVVIGSGLGGSVAALRLLAEELSGIAGGTWLDLFSIPTTAGPWAAGPGPRHDGCVITTPGWVKEMHRLRSWD